jgi:hypothetical protein
MTHPVAIVIMEKQQWLVRTGHRSRRDWQIWVGEQKGVTGLGMGAGGLVRLGGVIHVAMVAAPEGYHGWHGQL